MADAPNRNAARDKRLSIDRRQRVAAVNVLCAIDLPVSLDDWAKHVQESARICPGITMDEIETSNRRAALIRDKVMIEQLLQEGGAD